MRTLLWMIALLLPTWALAEQPVTSWSAQRAAAQRAFEQLHQRYPDADASWRPELPTPELVVGLDVWMPDQKTPETRARAFLSSHADLVSADVALLKLVDETRSRDRVTVHLAQWASTPVGPRPVLDRLVAVTMDAQGHILTLASDAQRPGALQPPTVTQAQAVATVTNAAFAGRAPPRMPAVLAVQVTPQGSRLVWLVDAGQLRVAVDAVTAEVVLKQPRVVK